MSLSQSSCNHYSLLADSDSNDNFRAVRNSKERFMFPRVFFIVCLTALFLVVGFIAGSFHLLANDNGIVTLSKTRSCVNPKARREWRSLSTSEKSEYIHAVQCLLATPSRLGLNHSAYDDFPLVHSLVGGYSHESAAFLTWHRYFLHVYEKTLEDQCSYTGGLVYWDWSLDWEDITQSPVWDSETGFGGNGNATAGESIINGHCVTSGPFGGLEVLYVKSEYRPHCLSRGFESPTMLAERRLALRPWALQDILRKPDYNSFNLGLENGPHNSIPYSVRGEFLLFTAPNDPVFFLHHTQLDRLWWMWQRAEPQNIGKRRREYLGRAAHNSTQHASLTDVIPMGGLAPNINVFDIMETNSGLLCYRY